MPPVKYSMAVEKAAKLAQPKHMALAPPAQHGTAGSGHGTAQQTSTHDTACQEDADDGLWVLLLNAVCMSG
jgi:hypothetical protein